MQMYVNISIFLCAIIPHKNQERKLITIPNQINNRMFTLPHTDGDAVHDTQTLGPLTQDN